ncbi:unnamed protein product [Cyclocybe aegerita]|uniref:Uncharacterized protein n=1 Tax=Cyclocybe aegerita TaxID=1973307 RepID=A0A8S0WCG8_CYCAE|nr:unnamed protein product [Cyclocybe aegerita]
MQRFMDNYHDAWESEENLKFEDSEVAEWLERAPVGAGALGPPLGAGQWKAGLPTAIPEAHHSTVVDVVLNQYLALPVTLPPLPSPPRSQEKVLSSGLRVSPPPSLDPHPFPPPTISTPSAALHCHPLPCVRLRADTVPPGNRAQSAQPPTTSRLPNPSRSQHDKACKHNDAGRVGASIPQAPGRLCPFANQGAAHDGDDADQPARPYPFASASHFRRPRRPCRFTSSTAVSVLELPPARIDIFNRFSSQWETLDLQIPLSCVSRFRGDSGPVTILKNPVIRDSNAMFRPVEDSGTFMLDNALPALTVARVRGIPFRTISGR